MSLRQYVSRLVRETAGVQYTPVFSARMFLETWLNTGQGSKRLIGKCIEVVRRYL